MKMRMSVNGIQCRGRIPGAALLICAAITATFAATTAAQTDPGRTYPYQAVVTEERVQIRAGGGDAYYPFGELKAGDIIPVAQERFNWARVLTRGPAFERMFGYVQERDLQRAPDGRSGIALGRVDVLAPNMTTGYAPESSWRPIGEIAAERTVRIIEAIDTDAGAYYKIVLPESTEGWVPMRFLRPATQAEVLAWEQRHRAAADGNDEGTAVRPAPPVEEGPVGRSQDNATVAPPTQDSSDSLIDAGDAEAVSTSTPPEGAAINDPLAREEEGEIRNVDLQSSDRATGAATSETTPISQIDALESAYQAIKAVPIREADVGELLERYRAVLESEKLDRREEVVVKARIELLSARLELQERFRALDQVRNRATMSVETVEAARLQIELAAVYAAVGVVNPSTIYDGRRLPLMFRLTDPATNRTIAYLPPNDQFDYLKMIGHLVGVVGEKSYDAGMRLNLITARRIDLLTVADQVR